MCVDCCPSVSQGGWALGPEGDPGVGSEGEEVWDRPTDCSVRQGGACGHRGRLVIRCAEA